jgi:hypothetical protein
MNVSAVPAHVSIGLREDEAAKLRGVLTDVLEPAMKVQLKLDESEEDLLGKIAWALEQSEPILRGEVV